MKNLIINMFFEAQFCLFLSRLFCLISRHFVVENNQITNWYIFSYINKLSHLEKCDVVFLNRKTIFDVKYVWTFFLHSTSVNNIIFFTENLLEKKKTLLWGGKVRWDLGCFRKLVAFLWDL